MPHLVQHEIEIRVRYSETDAMGYLHHTNYFNLFEVGRTELFRANGGDYRQLEQRGYFFVICNLTCKYYQPARYDDLLTLRTSLIRATPAKLEHQYDVLRGDQLLSVGTSLLACVNSDGVVQRLSDVVPEWCDL